MEVHTHQSMGLLPLWLTVGIRMYVSSVKGEVGIGCVARARQHGLSPREHLDALDCLECSACGVFDAPEAVHGSPHGAGRINARATRFVREADEV